MKVQLVDIVKRFGAVLANDHISLTVEPGTIHGLLGENGAGKSTLMKVFSGFMSADEGRILLDGKEARYRTPLEALRHGIGMLHQDALDFPPLSVLDNFLIGESGILQPRQRALRQFMENSRQFDFDIDPNAPAGSLSPGERQQLEIVRLLAHGAEVLVLDEPTTGISAPQKVKLFGALRTLIEKGKSIIFVSHKLEDAEDLCECVTVLRRGRVAGELAQPFNTATLVRLMFGQEILRLERPKVAYEKTLLHVENVTVMDRRLRLDRVNFDLRAGEVMAFAGLEGSGQRLVMRACGGLMKTAGGRLVLDNQRLDGKPYRTFLDSGIAYLPAARLDEGLVSGLDLTSHFELARRSNDFVIDWRRAQNLSESQIERFNIRGRPDSAVEDLSGGNQQRALLALLPERLRLLLLEHPTRGLDIESAQWVWSQLLERRKHGASIIFTSTDLDEVLTYADTVVVFSGSKVSAPTPAHDLTVERIGNMIGGKGF